MDPLNIDYDNSCFVVMPYEKRAVGDREVDFDWIYEHIFTPAIRSVEAGNGRHLQPMRQDRSYSPTPVHQRMFTNIDQAAVVMADITGNNPNVMVEIGVRIHTDRGGTVIVSQDDGLIFNLRLFQVVPYRHRPESKAQESIGQLGDALRVALALSRANVPLLGARAEIRAHTGATGTPTALDQALIDARIAMHDSDWNRAEQKYAQALAILPNNPMLHQLRGLTLRSAGNLEDAAREFRSAGTVSPDYTDAQRELGITATLCYEHSGDPTFRVEAETALQRAVQLSEHDAQSLTSLGKLLELDGRHGEAAGMYVRAAEHWGDNSHLLGRITELESRTPGPAEPLPLPVDIRPTWDKGELALGVEIPGIHTQTTREEVVQFLSQHGSVSDVVVAQHPTHDRATAYGLLRFGDVTTAEGFAQRIHNTEALGGRIAVNAPGSGQGFFGAGFGGLGPFKGS